MTTHKMRSSEAHRETDYGSNISLIHTRTLCLSFPQFQVEQGKAFVLPCAIHLYLLKSFTVFSGLSFNSQSECSEYKCTIYFYSFLHITATPSLALLCHFISSSVGLKAAWFAECCFNLPWSTLHKFRMIYFAPPTSYLDVRLIWLCRFCVE